MFWMRCAPPLTTQRRRPGVDRRVLALVVGCEQSRLQLVAALTSVDRAEANQPFIGEAEFLCNCGGTRISDVGVPCDALQFQFLEARVAYGSSRFEHVARVARVGR